MNKIIIIIFMLFGILFFASCGGDDDGLSNDPAPDVVENETKKEEIPEPEEIAQKVPAEAPKKERKIPDPNGVYLPTGEEKKWQTSVCKCRWFHDVVQRFNLEDYRSNGGR